MSFSSAYRMFRKDLKMKSYEITAEPLLKVEHKAQRKNFANCERKKFQKEDTMRILFSNEKMFDLDGIDNSENGPLIRRNQIGEVEKKQQEKFSEKVMV